MLLLPRSWRPIDIVFSAVVVAVASETAAGVPVSQRLGNWDSIHLRPSHPAIGNPNLSVLDFNLSVRFVLETRLHSGLDNPAAVQVPLAVGTSGPSSAAPLWSIASHCFFD